VYRLSFGEQIFRLINVTLILFIAVICLYPFWYVFVASFSDPMEVVRTSGIMIWFKGFDLYSYKEVFAHRLFLRSYLNTLIYLSIGLTINMTMTILGAYALSRREVKGLSVIMKLIVFTMFFSGGLIPTYIVVDMLNMTNTIWSQSVPYAINTFNLIIMRTAFASVPDSIEEAGIIDGASPFQIMVKLILPLSMPTIMVIGLYYSEEIWNSFFRALIYIRSDSLFPLQIVLRQILLSHASGQQSDQAFVSTNIQQSVKYATIIVSTVPILLVYPFIQRFFIKGVMIGSIKG